MDSCIQINKDLDDNLVKRLETLDSIYNYIIDKEEKINNNLNYNQLDREIQELELFRIREKKILEKSKNFYLAKYNKNESFSKLLSEIIIKQALLETFKIDKKKKILNIMLKNRINAEIAKIENFEKNCNRNLEEYCQKDIDNLAIIGFVIENKNGILIL